MGWERRGNRQYYYKKRRIGGRVESVYFGSGIVGLLAEAQVLSQRAGRIKDRQTDRKMRQLRYADQQLAAVEEHIQGLYNGVLLVNGYHLHARQWRKKRCRKQ